MRFQLTEISIHMGTMDMGNQVDQIQVYTVLFFMTESNIAWGNLNGHNSLSQLIKIFS